MFRDKIHDTAFQVLGPTTRKNQDWFDENDEEIKAILAVKKRLHRIYQIDQASAAKKTAFTNIRRTVQTRLHKMYQQDQSSAAKKDTFHKHSQDITNQLHKMQDSWLAAKADAIQKYDAHSRLKALL